MTKASSNRSQNKSSLLFRYLSLYLTCGSLNFWNICYACHISFSGLHALQRKTKKFRWASWRWYPLPQRLPLLPVKVQRCHLSLCAHALSTSHERLRGFWRPTHPLCLQAEECRRCHRCSLPPFHIDATHKSASYPFTPSGTNMCRVVCCGTFLVSLGDCCMMSRACCLYLDSPGVNVVCPQVRIRSKHLSWCQSAGVSQVGSDRLCSLL